MSNPTFPKKACWC